MDNDLIEQLLDTARISSEQERDRAQTLLTKSHYLVGYITATFVFLNAICVFLLKLGIVNAIWVVLLYAIPGILLCVAMWRAIKAQELVDVEYFPTGVDILKGIVNKKKSQNIDTTENDLKIDKIAYYSKYTDSLKKANDNKASILNSVYKLFTIDLWIILVGIAGIAVLVA